MNEKVIVVQRAVQQELRPGFTEGDVLTGFLVGTVVGIIVAVAIVWICRPKQLPKYNKDYWWNDGRKPDETE